MSIEKDIVKLETYLDKLESEDVDLEQSVDHYGEALKLASKTLQSLNKTQEKLIILQKQNEELITSTIPTHE